MAKVLIIEDSPSQAAIMAELVTQAGHNAHISPDLSKGVIQTVTPFDPDIVLLDLTLLGPDGKPIADGFQICKEIKRVSKNKIKVVVVSAREEEEAAEWAELQGADAFLHKPFAVEELVGIINQVLS
jgi:twitching motility two-component system response regulator PilH